MLIYDNNILENESKNNYIALGSFDGLHLGHLSLVEKVKKLAKQNNGLSIVFTFKNHPKKFINPNSDIKLIMNNDEKIKVLEKENIDILKELSIELIEKETMTKFGNSEFSHAGTLVQFSLLEDV